MNLSGDHIILACAGRHNLVCVMEDAMEMGSAAGRMNWLARSIHTTVPRGDWRAASSSEGKKKKKLPKKKGCMLLLAIWWAQTVFFNCVFNLFFFFWRTEIKCQILIYVLLK